MNGPLRGKHGCWTCRLRKKKCDEGRPRCSTCETLSITCYGFGPKPDWMNGGEKERSVANNIKDVVKHTSRRKAKNHAKGNGHIVNIAPKSLDAAVNKTYTSLESPRQHGVTPSVTAQSGQGSSEEDGFSMLHDDKGVSIPTLQ